MSEVTAPDSTSIARVRDLMAEKGMTQTDLARLTNIDRTELNRALNEKRDLKLFEAILIAGALQVDLAAVLDIKALPPDAVEMASSMIQFVSQAALASARTTALEEALAQRDQEEETIRSHHAEELERLAHAHAEALSTLQRTHVEEFQKLRAVLSETEAKLRSAEREAQTAKRELGVIKASMPRELAGTAVAAGLVTLAASTWFSKR